MSRLIETAFAAAVAFGGGPADAALEVQADPTCRVVRFLPSGRQIVTPPTQRFRGAGPSRTSSASASASAGSSAGVSVSSRSSGGGQASASASTSTGRRGRTVTTTHDENGCTVVIDDRAGPGARR